MRIAQLDKEQGSNLRSRGGALLLIQTDGYAAGVEAGIISEVLTGLGGDIKAADAAEAVRLVDLRRHSRGAEVDDDFRVGEDVAVPRSQLVHYVDQLQGIAERHGVGLKVVAHAGDGNTHPNIVYDPADPEAEARARLAFDHVMHAAIAIGGTITGEHGIGRAKRGALPDQLGPDAMALNLKIKATLDPQGILNPGAGM